MLLLISIASIAIQGFNLGIDFTGGVLVEAKAAHVIDIGRMRADVSNIGFKDPQIQYFGGGECDTPRDSCVLIRVQPKSAQPSQEVAGAIKAKLGPSYNYRRAEVVGPKVSGELFHAGILATVLAIIGIAAYVSVRFEWQYGIGAAIATGHDVLVTAGCSLSCSGISR